ncbi:hypothetical protein N752_30665 [Desulforamulus aquiferis]|nr:hypothetical protein N752_30665 [Desulforamulus aquiferis]
MYLIIAHLKYGLKYCQGIKLRGVGLLGKNVLVKVKSSRTDLDNETEIIELTSPGSFYKRGDSYYIIYKETAVTGMENATTSIKVQGRVITLVRSGSVNNRQVFELGKLHRSCYQTSFGNLDMAVKRGTLRLT